MNNPPVKAYIALGSNVGDRLRNLSEAKRLLSQQLRIRITAASPIYETEPVGCEAGMRPFFNAVIEVETRQSARELLDTLQRIEQEMGRDKTSKKNAPRVIDLDLLLLGQEMIADTKLAVPHPRMTKRRFVLQPLADIAPDLSLPGTHQSVLCCLTELKDNFGIRQVSQIW